MPPTAPGAFPYPETFQLHSKPGSNRTIFLDFDGHTVAGTAWTIDDTGPYQAPAYDSNGSPGFSNGELDEIQAIWQQVSEDYAPFDIDVTTQDPGTAAITRSSSTDEAYGTRVLVTNSDPGVCPSGPCGGVAFLGVIDQIGSEHDRLQPAWVFRSSLISTKNIGEAISHEAGHNLGLNHDGQLESAGCTSLPNGCEYYPGHGPWAPIMGVGYSRPVTQWSKGEYAFASQLEDDFAVMASTACWSDPTTWATRRPRPRHWAMPYRE